MISLLSRHPKYFCTADWYKGEVRAAGDLFVPPAQRRGACAAFVCAEARGSGVGLNGVSALFCCASAGWGAAGDQKAGQLALGLRRARGRDNGGSCCRAGQRQGDCSRSKRLRQRLRSWMPAGPAHHAPRRRRPPLRRALLLQLGEVSLGRASLINNCLLVWRREEGAF